MILESWTDSIMHDSGSDSDSGPLFWFRFRLRFQYGKKSWLRFRFRFQIGKSWSRLRFRLRFRSQNRPSLMPRPGIESGSPDPKARIIPLDRWLHPRFLSGYYTILSFKSAHFFKSPHWWPEQVRQPLRGLFCIFHCKLIIEPCVHADDRSICL